jgi:RNA polymerase sigma-70 factor, ECF subfamily
MDLRYLGLSNSSPIDLAIIVTIGQFLKSLMPSYITPHELNKLRNRDPELLTRIINEHTEVMLRTAWGLGWRGPDAEELVQASLATFLEAVERFEGRSSTRTYLLGILYMKALEARRAGGRELATDPIDQVFEQRFGYAGIWCTMPRGPEDEALAKETAGIVEQCVEGLPVQQRMAFFLKEVEHESTETLCKILDVTVTHLGVLLFRARNKLRECVQRKWGEETQR